MYLSARQEWTLTTPIVRIFSATFTDEVPDGDDERAVVAGPDAAWLVEQGTLLPVHDGDIRPAPAFLATDSMTPRSRT